MSFYVYWATSTRFRRQVKYLFAKKIWENLLTIIMHRNQIEPENEAPNMERRVSVIDVD
jgi:hypothetical protein